MNNIIVVSYKPDYDDVCMGCVRDRFSGEFEINQGTPEDIIPILVKLDFSTDPIDTSYGHTFIINGYIFGDEYKSYPDSKEYRKATSIFEDINLMYIEAIAVRKKEIEEAKRIQEEEKQRKLEEDKKQKELLLLKALKEKYEQ